MRRAAKQIAAVFAIAAMVSPAYAWEAATTHAGLAEQAAQSSKLHRRLISLGFDDGLYEPLTVPPADAPTLIKALSRLSPSHGYVPDARGRQYAMSWLAAGAAIADLPVAHAAHHFYDPLTRAGLVRGSSSVSSRARRAVLERLGRATMPARGMAAPAWVVAPDNPLGLDGFLDQYQKAVRAATPGERGRHMAGALVAAGAILHVLGDVGVPSRVRGDVDAHLESIGPGRDDLGSRFERIAALSYGRLGVPAPSRPITRTKLADFFAIDRGAARAKAENDDKKKAPQIGLADAISERFFSPNTLPADTSITASGGGASVAPKLARPAPALPSRLNLMAASQPDGTTLRDAGGTCLARYRVDDNVLRFSLDDDCVLEQIAAILPEVAAYETGLLDFLFRGELAVRIAGGRIDVAAGDVGLGAGDIEVLSEDARGVRSPLAAGKVAGAASGGSLYSTGAPSGTRRIVVVFRGVDGNGEKIVAAGSLVPGK
jgi:hypothetical protein